MMDFDELQQNVEQLMDLYHSVKEEIRRRDNYLFQRWKAGGFCVDNDIMSMYPALPDVMEQLNDDLQ